MSCLKCLLVLVCVGVVDGMAAEVGREGARAAVFSDGLPGFDQGLAREMGGQARAAGYAVEMIGVAVLTNQSLLTTGRYDLVVLPGARSLPMVAAPAIKGYLQDGGDLLALGLPAWESPVFEVQRQWLSHERYEATVAAQRAEHSVESFDRAELARWKRSSGDANGKAEYELAAMEPGKALHAKIGRLGGWQTLGSPAIERPFPAGHKLTCFRAKGGPQTRQLSLEWDEADGTRWIAVVDLATHWKDYTLVPERFKAWPVESAGKRRFNPANAVSFWVGVALSHTAVEGEQHEYWFDNLGTAPSPYGDAVVPLEPNVPALESVSPSYQCYPITTPVVVRADDLKMGLEEWEKGHRESSGETDPSPRPSPLLKGRGGIAGQPLANGDFIQGSVTTLAAFSCVGLNPRARGVGFEQGRPYRWEPLLGAYDEGTGDYRGAVGALVVNVEPPGQGSVWAVFTPSEATFYRQGVVSNCVRQVLGRMKRGVFLSEGGSEFFTVFAGQRFKAGARVVNFGRETVSNAQVTVKFLNSKGGSRTVLERGLTLAPGEGRAVEQAGLGREADESGVEATLSVGGAVIDGLRHELGVWEPKAKPEYIEAREGGFWLGGKPWKAHGVNYMPSSGIGLANWRYFEQWVGRGAYDPAVVERDLRRVKAMNLNAVSVFIYHDSLKAQHLLDLLRRCETLGLRVNLSLRPGTPMDFRWREMRELIEYYRVAQSDAVFAYDLAWEPTHRDQAHQQGAYAQDWNAWVLKRYGTVGAAEQAWGVAAPRTETNSPALSVPPMAQLTQDGEWRKLAADYRLFLDDLLRERYGAARDLVKSIDPHHAVSFRMTQAGDPQFNWDAALTYDFYGLAGAVDIWEPEAYGRIGNWERVRPGMFTAAYARLCDPAKPLIWAEMGYTVWDMNRMAPDPGKLGFEARYYTDFYRMMIESGADGVFFWWYPGGFRLGENSDFGIINPDGTDRPVTGVIRKEGARFLRARKPAKPDYWIGVDRDRDARGLYGIYEAVQGEFWKAVAEGRRPGLRWERKPGQKE